MAPKGREGCGGVCGCECPENPGPEVGGLGPEFERGLERFVTRAVCRVRSVL